MATVKSIRGSSKAKKKIIPRRPKTGLGAVPITGTFRECQYYFHSEIDEKTIAKICKEYVNDKFSKDDAAAILAHQEWNFSIYTGRAAAIFWANHGLEFEEPYQDYPEKIYQTYHDMIETGKAILSAKNADDNKDKPKPLSPQELLRRKVNMTVGYDVDDLEDQWINNEKSEIDLYILFQTHGLKGAAAAHLRDRIEFMRDEYEAAVLKTDECAVEAYDHLTTAELKRRLKVVNQMLDDLVKIESAAKATRKKRTPKVQTADKQVKDLKYLKAENEEYKLVSIDPLTVPGSLRLYTFNVKTRVLSEYVTTSVNGFFIKGTTIQNFDPDQSRSTKLRKPNDFLTLVLKKTPKQIDKEWSKLTTKTNPVNGRINDDTILLRVDQK